MMHKRLRVVLGLLLLGIGGIATAQVAPGKGASTDPRGLILPLLSSQGQIIDLIESSPGHVRLGVDERVAQGLIERRPARVRLPVPNGVTGGYDTVDLYRDDRPLAQAVTDAGQIVRMRPLIVYHTGGNARWASLSLIDAGPIAPSPRYRITGIFSSFEGAANIGLTEAGVTGGPRDHVWVPERDLDPAGRPVCHAEGLPSVKRVGGASVTAPQNLGGACAKVQVFVELDHHTYLINESDAGLTAAWAQGAMMTTSDLLARDSISIEMTRLYIHTRPDNYPINSSFDVLDQFTDTIRLGRRVLNAQLAHLISTKSTSLGGVAYRDVICNQSFNTGFSNTATSFQRLPVYSWTVNVIAHELGHNLGSPHTHSCEWPNLVAGAQPVDTCVNLEGNCDVGITRPRPGTVMSYCHITSRVDFNLGFGRIPGRLIRERISRAFCVSNGVYIPGVYVSALDTVCPGATARLWADSLPGVGYEWRNPSGIVVGNSPTLVLPALTASQIGTYTLRLTRQPGTPDACPAQTLTKDLFANCLPISQLSSTDVCAGGTVGLRVDTWQAVAARSSPFVLEVSEPGGAFTPGRVIDTVNASQAGRFFTSTFPVSLQAGRYRLRARSTHSAQDTGRSRVINVRQAGPSLTLTPAQRQGPGSLVLTSSAAPAGYRTAWYESETSPTPLALGPSFVTPVLPSTRTYWAQALPGPPQTLALVDMQGTQLTNLNHGLYFTVLQDMALDTVTVYPGGAGALWITIRELSTQRIMARQIYQMDGLSPEVRIPLRVTLPRGSYLIMADGSTLPSLFRSQNITPTYPHLLPGLVSIDSSTAPSQAGQFYYFFYLWKVRPALCAGPRLPVTASITNCSLLATPQVDSLIVRCAIGQGDTVTVAERPARPGVMYRLFAQPSGGAILDSATTGRFVFSMTQPTRIVYLEIRDLATGCLSERAAVRIVRQVVPRPALRGDTLRCGEGLIRVETSSEPGSQINWLVTGGLATTGDSLDIRLQQGVPVTVRAWSRDSQGCGSDTATRRLRALPIPNTPLLSQFGDTLSASGAGSFRWFFGVPPVLLMDTASRLIMTGRPEGDYRVQALGGPCLSDTSAPLLYRRTSHSAVVGSKLTVHPVPFDDELVLISQAPNRLLNVRLFDLTGRMIAIRATREPSGLRLTSERGLPSGVYWIEVELRGQPIERLRVVRR